MRGLYTEGGERVALLDDENNILDGKSRLRVLRDRGRRIFVHGDGPAWQATFSSDGKRVEHAPICGCASCKAAG